MVCVLCACLWCVCVCVVCVCGVCVCAPNFVCSINLNIQSVCARVWLLGHRKKIIYCDFDRMKLSLAVRRFIKMSPTKLHVNDTLFGD